MEQDLSKMQSNDGKAVTERIRKRTIKSPDQVQALENYYTDHKYPSEAMKSQLAEELDLTEKQVSGWFCYRRSKDKKAMKEENLATERRDKSAGLLLDRANAHRQDSCGSMKLGGDRYLNAGDDESESLTPRDVSPADLTYRHAAAPVLKHVSGPSGYLKVKSRSKNAAVTIVKIQLGREYQEDGPQLAAEFDLLPHDAFDSLIEEPVQETRYTGGTILPASANTANPHQSSNIYRGHEHNISLASCNLNADGRNIKKRQGSETPERPQLPSHTGVYCARDNSAVPLLIAGSRGPAERRQRCEAASGSQRAGRASVDAEVRAKKAPMKRKEYRSSGDKLPSGNTLQDGNVHSNRRVPGVNRVRILLNNDLPAPGREEEEISLQQFLEMPSAANQLLPNYRVMRSAAIDLSSSTEDDSPETL